MAIQDYPWVKILGVGALALASGLTGQELPASSGENCTFQAAPLEVMQRETLQRRQSYERALAYTAAIPAGRTVSPSSLPVRSFIDEEIFNRLSAEGMEAAELSTDEEFFRRINFDLTGRLPSSAEVRAFVADKSEGKRDALIERLLYSPGYIDRWTMVLADLFQNSSSAQNRSQQVEGRNRMQEYLQRVVATNQSWRDTLYQLVTATGNNYDRETPGVNFILRGFAPMGPAQDTYDLLMVKTATAFLGLGHYDCVMCHNGKYHLDAVSSWGARTLRIEAQRMSAHFARTSMSTYPNTDPTSFYINSTNVLNRNTGTYDLNTNYGNRPDRVAPMVNGKAQVNQTPVYRDGTAAGTASGVDWRDALARNMIKDPMFARNFANRIWKQLFGLALAEPVDGLDPDRLDPAKPPTAPWTFQASHPELLEKMANYVRENDYDMRDTIRFIVSSTAYQLSSRYSGDWDMTKASLFARHIPRRLDAEEVHDAIAKATALVPTYVVRGYADTVSLAMQLPEPAEPTSNGTAVSFMASFNRGNRDTTVRSQSGSAIMWLNLMNSSFVTGRTRASGTNASPFLVTMAANKANDAVVEEMFLTFLSRLPSEAEKKVAVATLAKSGTAQYTRVAAVEDLAWALINKVDFLYSY